MKICFLGLSGAGKTCYLYAASHVLTEGIHTSDGSVAILSTSVSRNIFLNKGIEDLENGIKSVWPLGSSVTQDFPYDLYINGSKKIHFEIYDYRGGALYDETDRGQDEREELYETFSSSRCIVVFIDAYTLMKAFSLKTEEDESFTYQRGGYEVETITKAMNKLNHLKLIINEAREKIEQDVPILLTITKKDILFETELSVAKERLKEHMSILFSEESTNPVAITAVSLGENLGVGEFNEDNCKRKLIGCLHLDVSQNLHIPILFPLFMGVKLSENDKNIAKRIFNNNVIQLYVKGKPAYIAF